MSQYNIGRFLPSSLYTICLWMTLGLPENKVWVSTHSECSRRWQGSPYFVTVTSNTCWRSPPAWVCCNTSCSKFTLAGDVHLCHAFINMLLPDLHLEWETTCYLEGSNKLQQTLWKGKACWGNIWTCFSWYWSASSSNRFGSWLSSLGPKEMLFKAL